MQITSRKNPISINSFKYFSATFLHCRENLNDKLNRDLVVFLTEYRAQSVYQTFIDGGSQTLKKINI
jgi:hypothetical protein